MRRVSNEYGVLEVRMQTKIIMRPRPHYQRSFKYPTARIVSFGAWQNLELACRMGDFVN